jgi:hypothetical protein
MFLLCAYSYSQDIFAKDSAWEKCANAASVDQNSIQCGSRGCFDDFGDDLVIIKCGYKPTSKSDCSDLYFEVYLAARDQDQSESLDDLLSSNVISSYYRYMDPDEFNLSKLKKLIKTSEKLSRADFGAIFCGNKLN